MSRKKRVTLKMLDGLKDVDKLFRTRFGDRYGDLKAEIDQVWEWRAALNPFFPCVFSNKNAKLIVTLKFCTTY